MTLQTLRDWMHRNNAEGMSREHRVAVCWWKTSTPVYVTTSHYPVTWAAHIRYYGADTPINEINGLMVVASPEM
jgi:hypothetical protein